MKRVLVSLLFVTGCYELPKVGDPPVCTAHLIIAGQIEDQPPRPMDCGHLGTEACSPQSCWPHGLWRFRAMMEDGSNTCDPPPVLEDEYAFRVSLDAREKEVYEYLTRPELTEMRLKVTSGGGGLCEGSLEIYSEDATGLITLKPALQADGSIDGAGDFDRFPARQWDENPNL